MRIGFVIDHYQPGKGGLEVWLAGISAFLTGTGDEVVIVTHESLPPRGRSRASRDRDFAERAREHTRAAGFDVVVGLRHCLSCDLYAPHGGSVAAGFEAHRRAKLLSSLPSAKVRNFIALERELLTGAAPPRAILAVSEMVRRDLAERFPGIAERITVVPNGVDLDRFSPDGREAARERLGVEGKRVLLFLAGNPKLKGLKSVKEVFSRLKATDDRTVLLTAGGDPGRLPTGARHLPSRGGRASPSHSLRPVPAGGARIPGLRHAGGHYGAKRCIGSCRPRGSSPSRPATSGCGWADHPHPRSARRRAEGRGPPHRRRILDREIQRSDAGPDPKNRSRLTSWCSTDFPTGCALSRTRRGSRFLHRRRGGVRSPPAQRGRGVRARRAPLPGDRSRR